jgi:hypothetical protein
VTKRTNKGRINCGVVIRAVPSDPRKRPKKPATELPRRGKKMDFFIIKKERVKGVKTQSEMKEKRRTNIFRINWNTLLKQAIWS